MGVVHNITIHSHPVRGDGGSLTGSVPAARQSSPAVRGASRNKVQPLAEAVLNTDHLATKALQRLNDFLL